MWEPDFSIIVDSFAHQTIIVGFSGFDQREIETGIVQNLAIIDFLLLHNMKCFKKKVFEKSGYTVRFIESLSLLIIACNLILILVAPPLQVAYYSIASCLLFYKPVVIVEKN